MRKLVLCGACARHVRAEERACPFCGAACGGAGQVTTPVEAGRLRGRPGGRAALFLASVAGATPVVGCDKEEEEEMAVPVYGVPVDDAGTREDAGGGGDDGGATDGSANDDAMAAPVYGVPVDAGSEDSGSEDSGQVVPVYGVPIDAGEDAANDPPDASDDGEIMAVPLYGLAVDDVE